MRTVFPGLWLPVVLVCVAGCRDASLPVASVPALFGPVIGNEVIAGRSEDLDTDGPVWLLAGQRALVRIDLGRRTSSRRELPIPVGETCWGLARLRDGSLWTLRGHRSLVQLSGTGDIARTIPLADSYFGLFGAGDRLLYQKAAFIAPAQALFAGPPGDSSSVPFGSLQTRAFPLARASVAALNLLSCGASQTRVRPCWFPNEPTIWLANDRGQMRKITIAGLSGVAPEVLLTSEAPARPVRDAYVDREEGVWVLSTGTAPLSSTVTPGGWQLGRYSREGAALKVARLKEAVRLILRAEPDRAWVITSAGTVAEVSL